MAASMKLLLVCMRFSTLCKRCNLFKVFKVLNKRITTRKWLTGSAIILRLSMDEKGKIEEPDPAKLTREYLIKSATINATEHTIILLTQVALALEEAEKEYQEALLAAAYIMQLKLQVLGNEPKEARLWDLILQSRTLINDTKKKKQQLELLYQSALTMLNSAAEITYYTGAEIVGNSAGYRINKLDLMLRHAKENTLNAEIKLRDIEIQAINVEGKYAEEHSEELEMERRTLVQQQNSAKQTQESERINDNTVKLNKINESSYTIIQERDEDRFKDKYDKEMKDRCDENNVTVIKDGIEVFLTDNKTREI